MADLTAERTADRVELARRWSARHRATIPGATAWVDVLCDTIDSLTAEIERLRSRTWTEEGQAAYAAWRADHDPEPQVERLCREAFELGLRLPTPPSGDGRDDGSVEPPPESFREVAAPTTTSRRPRLPINPSMGTRYHWSRLLGGNLRRT